MAPRINNALPIFMGCDRSHRPRIGSRDVRDEFRIARCSCPCFAALGPSPPVGDSHPACRRPLNRRPPGWPRISSAPSAAEGALSKCCCRSGGSSYASAPSAAEGALSKADALAVACSDFDCRCSEFDCRASGPGAKVLVLVLDCNFAFRRMSVTVLLSDDRLSGG